MKIKRLHSEKTSALEAVFARLFRIVAGKEYLINLQWSAKANSHSRPLHASLIRFVIGSCCVLFIGLAGLLFESGQWLSKEIRFELARSKNQAYLEDLQSIQTSLSALEITLDTTFLQEQKMRALYGIHYLDPSVSAFGIGGRAHPTASDSMFSKGMYESLFKIGLKSHQLKSKLDFTTKNLKQISEFVFYRHNLWNHTPSVIPARGTWTSGYGFRTHPITGEYVKHEGLDISGSKWTPIFVTADGIVSSTTDNEGFYGKCVVVDHSNGFSTRYAHLNQFLVEKGQLVKRYALIGYMGNTGRVTGTHLHYEVLRDGITQNPERFILPAGLIVD